MQLQLLRKVYLVYHLENGAVLSRSLLCPYQVLNQGC